MDVRLFSVYQKSAAVALAAREGSCGSDFLANQGTRSPEHFHHNHWGLTKPSLQYPSGKQHWISLNFAAVIRQFILKNKLASGWELDVVSQCRIDAWTPTIIFCTKSKQIHLFRISIYSLPAFICISKFFQRHQLRKHIALIFCLFLTTEAMLNFITWNRNVNKHLEYS